MTALETFLIFLKSFQQEEVHIDGFKIFETIMSQTRNFKLFSFQKNSLIAKLQTFKNLIQVPSGCHSWANNIDYTNINNT